AATKSAGVHAAQRRPPDRVCASAPACHVAVSATLTVSDAASGAAAAAAAALAAAAPAASSSVFFAAFFPRPPPPPPPPRCPPRRAAAPASCPALTAARLQEWEACVRENAWVTATLRWQCTTQ